MLYRVWIVYSEMHIVNRQWWINNIKIFFLAIKLININFTLVISFPIKLQKRTTLFFYFLLNNLPAVLVEYQLKQITFYSLQCTQNVKYITKGLCHLWRLSYIEKIRHSCFIFWIHYSERNNDREYYYFNLPHVFIVMTVICVYGITEINHTKTLRPVAAINFLILKPNQPTYTPVLLSYFLTFIGHGNLDFFTVEENLTNHTHVVGLFLPPCGSAYLPLL